MVLYLFVYNDYKITLGICIVHFVHIDNVIDNVTSNRVDSDIMAGDHDKII